MNSSSRSSLVAISIAMALLASVGDGLAEPKISFKPQLKARVRELGSAYMKGDWLALLKLVAPFVRECTTAEELREGWTSDSSMKLLSLRLKGIQYDSLYVGETLHVDCTGLDYKVEAGAITVVTQVTQHGDAEPSRGDNYFNWVLIDGIWFLVGSD